MAAPVQRTVRVSVEQSVHQIDRIVLFLIDDFGVHLCHLHVGMTEQFRGGIEVGAEVALFEPIHGSYPQAAGKNIANPMATILSAAMLLEHVGLKEEGKAVRAGVNRAIEQGVVTEDLASKGAKVFSTTEVGDFIAATIR